MFTILTNTRRPDITFRKSGRIDIASRIAKLLGIKTGDVIDIAVDNGEYYLYVRTYSKLGRHEGTCFPGNTRAKVCNSFRAHSIHLCRYIFTIAQCEGSARLPCGELCELPIGRAIPIIIKNNLK